MASYQADKSKVIDDDLASFNIHVGGIKRVIGLPKSMTILQTTDAVGRLNDAHNNKKSGPNTALWIAATAAAIIAGVVLIVIEE